MLYSLDIKKCGHSELMEEVQKRTPCPGQQKGYNTNIRNFPLQVVKRDTALLKAAYKTTRLKKKR
jgi:hypothetical protein